MRSRKAAPQFSIRTLMIAVAVAAVAIASLLYANPIWATLWITTCLLILLASLIGIGYTRYERRAFFAGFSILGWGYFLATWNVIGSLTAEYLATTVVLELLKELIQPTTSDSLFSGISILDMHYRETMNHVGHSIFNLAIAFGGGMLGRFAYRRREKVATQPPPLP